MRQLRKRLIAVFLSFSMLLLNIMLGFNVYAGPPSYLPIAQVTDPDVTMSVTYDDVAVTGRGNSNFYVGETVPYYVNILVSSATRSIPGAYSKVYLPKAIFGGGIIPANVSSWENKPATNYLSIDNTGNADYVVITMKYRNLIGGITQSVPFRATIQSNTLKDGESYTIPLQVYDSNDTLIASKNNTFVAHTYPVGVNVSTESGGVFQLLLGSTDLQNSTTLSNSYKSTIKVNSTRTTWPAPGTTIGTTTGVISVNGWTAGADRRKTRVTVELPANANFDPSDNGNAGWTYNVASRTITRDELYGNVYWTIPQFTNSFVVTYNNQPVGSSWSSPTTVSFPTSWQYVNDDGTLDPESLEKTVVNANYYTYVGHAPIEGGPRITKSSEWAKALGTRENSLHTYNLLVTWLRDDGVPVQYYDGTVPHTISSIVDTPAMGDEIELVSYKINFNNSYGRRRGTSGPSSYEDVLVWNPAQIAAMQHNKLIGTKLDGSTEVIATDIAIGATATEVTLSNPKIYTKIELKFDNPIQLQVPAWNVIAVQYKFRLAESTYNRIKPLVEALPSPTDWSIATKNTSALYGDGQATPLNMTSDYNGWTRWTKSSVIESAHSKQNYDYGTQYVDNTITLDDNVNFSYNLSGQRDIKKPKFLFLVDSGLEFTGADSNSTWTPEFSATDLANYRVEYNYKGTGKTAYIWDQLPDIHFPNAAAYSINSSRAIYLNPTFKFKSNVRLGPGTIDSYMYWENNEQDTTGNEVTGLYPDDMDLDNDGNTTEKFSHKQVKYLFSPPLELILTKDSKRADAAATQYSTVTTADSEQMVDYQLNIFNNSNGTTSGLTFFDILPHVGDKSVLPNSLGQYTDRGSTYGVKLAGPVVPVPGYTFYYSTDPVTEGNINANVIGASWATSVADYSQVTMIKAVMNPGYSLGRGATDLISFKVKMPNTTALAANDKAVNTFAGFAGNNYNGGVEALNNIVVPKKYKISGKVYYDVPAIGDLTGNGKNLSGDLDIPAPGKTVEIYYSDGLPVLDATNNPVTTTTDTNGDYSFENLIKTDTYKIVVKPGPTIKISSISVPSTATLIGNDFTDATQAGGEPAFNANVSVTPSADTKTANAALFADNSGLVIKYFDTAGNPVPLDDNSGNVPDMVDHSYRFKAPYNITPATSPTGADNFIYDSVDTSNGGYPLSGNLEPGEITVKLRYKRKAAGNITVHHYELGHTDELYTPSGLAGPSAEILQGVEKQGLTVNITNRSADIPDLDFDNVDVSGAINPTTPGGAGETTLTYRTLPQSVIYYYKRKNAGNITVHHYEVGQSTELYKPGASLTVAPEIFDGAGKRGLPENLTNREANIANYEYVSVDTSSAPGTVSTVAAGATTVKYQSVPQSVIYRYKRKNAGNVTVNYLENGTNTVIDTREVLDGTSKLGLPFTTVQKNVTNFDFVSVVGATTGTYIAADQTVNYYYTRKNAGNVTVNYIEYGTNTVLATQEILNGTQKLGLPFTTVQKAVTNYEFSSVSPSATGIYTATPQTINYYYVRGNAGNVLVHHYEAGTSTSLVPDEVLYGAGKLGLTYTTNPANIPNFSVVNATPPNHTGVYHIGGLTVVTYEYVRDNAGDVTVHHLEQGTSTQLMPDVTLSGIRNLGLSYITNDLSIPNFALVAQPGNKSGIYSNTPQSVTYLYKRADAGDVLVHYVEAGTSNSLSPDMILSGAGKSGLPYSTAPVPVTNFTVVSINPTDYVGTYTAGVTKVVTYEYVRDSAADITVRHIEQGTGIQLATTDTLSGVRMLGLPYITSEKDIQNFDLTAQPVNKIGTFMNYPQLVTYAYKRKSAGNIEVVYVDTAGNELAIQDTISGIGMLGLPYTTWPKTVTNFTLTDVPANANGIFTTGPHTVTYVYKRSDAADVTVYNKSVYDSCDLTQPIVMSGMEKLGLPYTTSEQNYDDWEIYSLPSNARGIYTSWAQSITYLYKRKMSGGVTINYMDNHGKKIETTDTISGSDNVGLPYTTTPKNILYYDLIVNPENANGNYSVAPITVDYIYRRQDAGKVTIKYVDECGNQMPDTPDDVLNGSEKVGLPYTSSPKEFEFFDLVSVPDNANGVFTPGEQTVTYVYKRKDAGMVIAYYVDWARLRVDTDVILDGTRSLGLPYTTSAKYVPGYHLVSVAGRESGVFRKKITEIYYFYDMNPSPVIIPGPLPPRQISLAIIPGQVNPSIIATPSQIVNPADRNQDLIIRPGVKVATSSVATASNGNRGGGEDNSIVRPVKVIGDNNRQGKDSMDNAAPWIEKPLDDMNKAAPQRDTLLPDTKGLSVPKTADSRDIRGYFFILISSLTAAISLVLKKKENK